MAGALAMAGSLLWCQLTVLFQALLGSIAQGIHVLSTRKHKEKHEDDDAEYSMYEGVVWHERKHPVRHQFQYKVRYSVVNLSKVPSWFQPAALHHMSALEAREIAGTVGPVHLLCMPASLGYEQNPLSVYYCYDDEGRLAKGIAEVTNTPWGERVTFVFDPSGDTVAKPLHVSPFMDMAGSWLLHAPAPGEKLALTIRVEHPEFGNFFVATLRASKVVGGLNPESFSWLMPHKVAVYIYWQAIVLLWKGVAFVQHPKYIDGDAYRGRARARDGALRGRIAEADAVNGSVGEGGRSAGVCGVPEVASGSQRFCTWREAAGSPWL